MTRTLVAAVLAAAAGVSCAVAPASPPPPAPTTTPEATAVTGSGRVISRSDVGGLPDSPVESGSVLVVPADKAAALVSLAGAGDLAHASFAVSDADARGLGAAVVPIGADGRFALPDAPGRYLVCLADTFPDHEPGPPYSVVGCAAAELPAPGLTVSFGEGGVQAGS
ncbi:hypothetical protein ACFQV2_17585 [Actinokineospora soli]|uniref:Lipoprotein n=1 Tax=Actinokineospora soli TaxID=1048753 RepID=A0ABW2TPX2_9PSEU